MVGFTPELNLEDLDQASKLKLSKDPPDAVDPRPIDLSFVDSLLDFDSIENWFMDIPNPDMAETGTTTMVKSEPIDCEPGGVVKVKMESEISENLSCCIEEELGKFSLLGSHEESSVLDNGNAMISERVNEGLKIKIEGEDGVKSKKVSGSESESSEESESESSSASSSSSSSSDDDEEEEDSDDMEKKRDEACELEEGEIRGADQIANESGDEDDDDDVEVAWSDVDIFDEGDEEEEAIKGPIRSKNELEVRRFSLTQSMAP